MKLIIGNTFIGLDSKFIFGSFGLIEENTLHLYSGQTLFAS